MTRPYAVSALTIRTPQDWHEHDEVAKLLDQTVLCPRCGWPPKPSEPVHRNGRLVQEYAGCPCFQAALADTARKRQAARVRRQQRQALAGVVGTVTAA